MIFTGGKKEISDISGILVVDKEKGMTSHDVVDLVRKRFGLKKVGHAGTLDPDATGVLVLLVGRATKLSGILSGEDKAYRAVMRLGERTDTGDAAGRVISEKDVAVGIDDIRNALKNFEGEIEQVPPMFSAKKIKGKRLYDLARKGQVVERPPVRVTVKKLEILRVDLPDVEFDVLCTKGTYIRQLADDIGEELGCGAHLVELRRTSSGNFRLDKAFRVSKLSEMSRESFNENIERI
jgi:tRNA pseudouridine55 synthase